MNKFVSFLDHVGHEFKRGLDALLPVAETAGEVAFKIFLPGVSPLFNATVAAVVTAEQNFSAVGKQTGSGPQKLSSVVSFMGPLIAQGLADVGKSNDQKAVEKYVDAVATILNAIPAPAPAAITVPIPAGDTNKEVAAVQSAGQSGAAITELLHG